MCRLIGKGWFLLGIRRGIRQRIVASFNSLPSLGPKSISRRSLAGQATDAVIGVRCHVSQDVIGSLGFGGAAGECRQVLRSEWSMG